MGKLNIAAGDWILVCDGKKAIILENAGDRKFPNLRVKAVREHDDAPTRDLGTDAPARVFASVGSARSATEATDWHDEAERAFLRKLVANSSPLRWSGSSKVSSWWRRPGLSE